jgi:hypothetical protein
MLGDWLDRLIIGPRIDKMAHRDADLLERLIRAEAERDAARAEVERLRKHVEAANTALAAEGRTTHDTARSHLVACMYGGAKALGERQP